jgi:hypothetical protein
MNNKRPFSMATASPFHAIIASLSLIMALGLTASCSSTQSDSGSGTDAMSEIKTNGGRYVQKKIRFRPYEVAS